MYIWERERTSTLGVVTVEEDGDGRDAVRESRYGRDDAGRRRALRGPAEKPVDNEGKPKQVTKPVEEEFNHPLTDRIFYWGNELFIGHRH